MCRNVRGKGLTDKKNRLSEEDAMLELLLHGSDLVSADPLSNVLNWYMERKELSATIG